MVIHIRGRNLIVINLYQNDRNWFLMALFNLISTLQFANLDRILSCFETVGHHGLSFSLSMIILLGKCCSFCGGRATRRVEATLIAAVQTCEALSQAQY